LTTLRQDGPSHTTPVWLLLTDETFWTAGSTANVKVRNLSRGPRVFLADQTLDGPRVLLEVPVDRWLLALD